MIDLLLFPAGGNAREAVSVVHAMNAREPAIHLLGFIDDDTEHHGATHCGYAVVGGRELLRRHPDAKLLAVPGTPESFRGRLELIGGFELPAERWTTLIHPSAELGVGVEVGENTLIMAGVVATANVKIGAHCVILPNAVIAHDATIGAGSMVGSNVSIAATVHIEEECYIGGGSRIIQDVTIRRGTLVGLGAVVLRDTQPGQTVVGNPARARER